MQIRFEFNTKYGVYKDALNLPDDHTLTEDEILQMQQARIDRWVYNIENPIVVVDAPVEEAPTV